MQTTSDESFHYNNQAMCNHYHNPFMMHKFAEGNCSVNNKLNVSNHSHEQFMKYNSIQKWQVQMLL